MALPYSQTLTAKKPDLTKRTELLPGQAAAAAITAPEPRAVPTPVAPSATVAAPPRLAADPTAPDGVTTGPAAPDLAARSQRALSGLSNAQVNNGTFRKADAPQMADYGDSPLGAFVNSLVQNRQAVRAQKEAAALAVKQVDADTSAASDIFKERMANERNQATLAREDMRQAATGEREQARLDFDKEKELNAQMRSLFETEEGGVKSFDQEGFMELKDYMTSAGERDPYKAQQSFRQEALQAAKSYQTPENLLAAIAGEKDATKKKKMERVYSIAYGAVPTK